MNAENTGKESPNERLDQRNLSIQGDAEESTVILGDRNTINQGPSYYTTNVFGSFDVKQFSVRPVQQLSKEEYRWRQVLVQNVKHYWIEGVLEKSLHNQALIELGLEERSQALASPISGVEEFINEANKCFSEGTQATDIFDSLGAGRTLLLLGEPGSGKTTTLLKLAKTLLTRIGDDFSQSIPVILNLSSWAKKRQPIEEWLVQDLYETFQISKALGTIWIREEQLTLCLDGLDEVATQHRNACLQALNHFLRNHGRTEIVVCSRIRDYEALSGRLSVRCAIYVQPLTAQQINRYLSQAGEQLSALTTVFKLNPEIRAFASSPLILSVMSLAYKNCTSEEISTSQSNLSDYKEELFEKYIERMFQRRGTPQRYSQEKTRQWLAWLARHMQLSAQTVFLIERLQPTWLSSKQWKVTYRILSSCLSILGVGLVSGLSIGLMGTLRFNPRIGVNLGLASGLVSGLVGGIIVGFQTEIDLFETLKFSWKSVADNISSALIHGALASVATFLLFELIFGYEEKAINGLLNGLFGGLLATCFSGAIHGLRSPAIQQSGYPNQGIWKSAKNAVLIGIGAGFAFTLASGLVLFGGAISKLLSEVRDGLILWPIVVCTGGLLGGGSACIKHVALRLMLYSAGDSPRSYADFLDYATERLFLRKVGGGYIFIHRMLLEHFAQVKR